MSGTEGQEPGGTDPIDLQLPRGATGSSREQSTPQSTAPVTRLIDTTNMECHSGMKGKGKMHKGLGFQPERGDGEPVDESEEDRVLRPVKERAQKWSRTG